MITELKRDVDAKRDAVLALVAELNDKRATIARLRRQADGNGDVDPPMAATVQRLFDYWRQACRHPHAKLTTDRRRKITARLRDGYEERFIMRAIDGAAAAPFRDDRGKPFDDIELICRNGSKLEGFARRIGRDDNGDGLRRKLVGE